MALTSDDATAAQHKDTHNALSSLYCDEAHRSLQYSCADAQMHFSRPAAASSLTVAIEGHLVDHTREIVEVNVSDLVHIMQVDVCRAHNSVRESAVPVELA
jgi:hypothetical protein